MIVKCDQCQTRFKIPDEKVTEKGVKVRCTKCAHTFRVKRQAGEAADPFAVFGSAPEPPRDQSTRPGFFAAGVAASSTSGKSPGQAPAPPPQWEPPPTGDDDPFAEVPTRAGLVPANTLAEARGAIASSPPAVDFSFEPPPPSTPDFEPPPATSRPPPPPGKGRGSPAGVSMEADRQALFGGYEPPAPPASPPSTGSLPDEPVGSHPSEGNGGLFGGADPAAALGHDPFGSPPSPGGGPATGAPGERREDLFGGFEAPDAAGMLSDEPLGAGGTQPDDQGRGLFDIPEPPSEPAPRPPARESHTTSKKVVIRPVGRPEDARGLDDTSTQASAAARQVSGWVMNLAVAAALAMGLLTLAAVYVNEGKLDASSFSAEGMRELLFPTQRLSARAVSNGLYETAEGRPVFFVKGEVHNNGETLLQAQVRASILDGKQLVRSAETLAGQVPTPEQLHGIRTAGDLTRLGLELSQAARPVAPGERVPFLVAFYEYPPDLSRYRLSVEVNAVEPPAPPAAR